MTWPVFCPNRHSVSTRAYPTSRPAVKSVRAYAGACAGATISPRSRWPGLARSGRAGCQDVVLHQLLPWQHRRGGSPHRPAVRLPVDRAGTADGGACLGRAAIAATAFTALVDALWISLFALRPGNNIPTASLVLGLIGLTSTAGLTIRLWRARGREKLSNRWPFLLLAITGLYGPDIDGLHRRQQPGGALGRRDARVHFLRGLASSVPGNCLACAAEACLTC